MEPPWKKTVDGRGEKDVSGKKSALILSDLGGTDKVIYLINKQENSGLQEF